MGLTTTPLSGVLEIEPRTPMSYLSPVPSSPIFLRRLGPDPHADGAKTPSAENCPDILELSDGNFAVIGIDMTAQSLGHLPPSVGCGPDERVVWIPRSILLRAKPDIPDETVRR